MSKEDKIKRVKDLPIAHMEATTFKMLTVSSWFSWLFIGIVIGRSYL